MLIETPQQPVKTFLNLSSIILRETNNYIIYKWPNLPKQRPNPCVLWFLKLKAYETDLYILEMKDGREFGCRTIEDCEQKAKMLLV